MVNMAKGYGYTCSTFRNMAYFRFITTIAVLLMFLYYAMIVGQLFGFWKITNKEISFVKLCIPFYYWIVSQKK